MISTRSFWAGRRLVFRRLAKGAQTVGKRAAGGVIFRCGNNVGSGANDAIYLERQAGDC
jgi:hypothetical protein